MVRMGWMGLLVLAVLVAGCGSQPAHGDGEAQMVTIAASDIAFDQKEIRVEKGRPVMLTMENTGALLHDFTVEHIPAEVHEAHGDSHGGHGDEYALHLAVAAGKKGTLEFTPTEAGTYVFYCTVEGHREAGMEGKIVVR